MSENKLEPYDLYVESFGRTHRGGKTDSDHFRGPRLADIPGPRFDREQVVAVTLGVCHAREPHRVSFCSPTKFEYAMDKALGK